ncbi:MAG: glycerol acyltransferase, partial [Myxococcales bacterium]|nr:glycerol acyltransferase [Myxococcales bacterium]
GVPGISKRYSERYELREFRTGHAELAIRFGATVVPTALVGAEEQMPQLARLPIPLFGAPFLPLPATPFPLPVRYHLRYGAPIRFEEPPTRSDEPAVIRRAAARVQEAVAALLDEGLAERKGIFR